MRRLRAQGNNDVYQQVLLHFDRVFLGEVPREVDGKQVKACRRLGIARMTLRSKLRACGLLASAPGELETEDEID